MKDRDITADEINKITALCPIREKAFLTIMRQSGLPPHTIKQLKMGNVERILEPNPPIPCKINVPREKSPTFIGEEGVKYLKKYLKTRRNLTPESLLFTIRNNPNKEINTKDVSRAFKQAAQELEKTKKITYEIRRGKPSELTLYSLIYFYRKNAKDYLTELNNSSTPKDNDFYRELYEETALPSLEIEPLTPMELHQLETQNRQLTQQLAEIKNKILPKELEKVVELPPEYWEDLDKQIKEHEEYERWLKVHPEEEKREKKRREEASKEYDKWVEEHPEDAKKVEEELHDLLEQDQKFYREELEGKVKELKSKLNEIEDVIRRHRENRAKKYSRHFPSSKTLS